MVNELFCTFVIFSNKNVALENNHIFVYIILYIVVIFLNYIYLMCIYNLLNYNAKDHFSIMIHMIFFLTLNFIL